MDENRSTVARRSKGISLFGIMSLMADVIFWNGDKAPEPFQAVAN